MDSQYRCDRRGLLRAGVAGAGMLALGGLLAGARADDAGGADAPAPQLPHFPPKATSVIWLFMEGGPSGFDLFDPKPELEKRDGQRVAGIQTHFGNPGPLLRSPFTFAQHGQWGHWVCDRYPTLAGCVDDLALIKSVWAESPNHAPAMYQMNTGIIRPGFPSAPAPGSITGWARRNRDFPGFVVLGGGGDEGRCAQLGQRLPALIPTRAPCCAPSGPGRSSIWRAPATSMPAPSAPCSTPRRQAQPASSRIPSGRQRAQRPGAELRAGGAHGAGRARDPRPRRRGCRDALSAGLTAKPGPASSAPNACSPGAWSSAACASSRSTATTNGMPMAISRPTMATAAGKPMCRSPA